MKQLVIWVLLALTVKASGLLPFESRDVAKLAPIRALTVSVEDGQVVLDGGDCQGRGESWSRALSDLRRGAQGEVFLETADQLILSGPAVSLLPEIVRSESLRPGADVCRCGPRPPDPEEAADYLSAHETGLTLLDVRRAMVRGERVELPVLAQGKGGLRLYEAGR